MATIPSHRNLKKMNRMLASALLSLAAMNAGATDLLQVWRAASQHDLQGAVLEAGRAAGAARRQQGAALWRPSLGLSASAGWSSADSRMEGAQFSAPAFADMGGPVNQASVGTSIHGGTATRWALSARQPVYDAARSAQSRQLGIAADAAELEYRQGRQDWMLQLTQRYFELALAERRLALLGQQHEAVERALTEARDRFALGDIPVTDTHEAAARARGLQAQLVAAGHEFELARQQLADVSGLPVGELKAQAPATGMLAGAIEPLAHWQDLAGRNNPMLLLQQAQLDAASQEVRKHELAASPTLDLVAQAARERLSGSGDFGAASNTQSQQMVGVAFNLPLYTGGWRSAKLEESLRLQDKARAQLEQARLQVGQQTRSAWLALQSGQARLAALEQASGASQARLESTRLGRQVGDRTTLDLLNAENDATAAELALLQGRVELLQSRLRLQAQAGQLDEQGLQAVNAALRP
jgi:outer membrane protein